MKTTRPIIFCSLATAVFSAFVGVCYAEVTEQLTNTTEGKEDTTEEENPKLQFLTVISGFENIYQGLLTVADGVITIPINIANVIYKVLRAIVQAGILNPVSW